MDRTEKPQRPHRYAELREVSPRDAPFLETPAGRADDDGASDPTSPASDEIHRQDVGATPRSTVTGRHQPGMGGEETEDGLSGSEEAVRHAAEDVGTGDGTEDRRDMPVFDRADAPPKI
ncbi:hypothetical protein RA307_20285 [Xanthobacteraceae bacterium Astr-EGSB]|uniref:hypothetical protein n=1 Tax=Astrobacterium formosum TaxID=3069710 RepID=UPI0027AE8477|nr:hypothetical protein [Xanthobacteraceae bacterium Astr-EGSB]